MVRPGSESARPNRNADDAIELQYLQSFQDGLNKIQHTHALHLRGPASCHAVQGMLGALMASRLPTDQVAATCAVNEHNKRARRRSKRRRQEERQQYRAFLASYKQPMLYILRDDLVSQAMLKLIERSDCAQRIRTVDVNSRTDMPTFLQTYSPPILVDRRGVVHGNELFQRLSEPSLSCTLGSK
jgi:hypothetical protein